MNKEAKILFIRITDSGIMPWLLLDGQFTKKSLATVANVHRQSENISVHHLILLSCPQHALGELL